MENQSVNRAFFKAKLNLSNFIYAQSYFYEFIKKHENIKIDLLIDYLDKKEKTLLLDWILSTKLFDKIYFKPKIFFSFSKLKKELRINNYGDFIFDLNLDIQKETPLLNIPKDWMIATKLNFLKWGINDNIRLNRKVIFINTYTNNFKKTISISKIFDFIDNLSSDENFFNTIFVINSDLKTYKKYEKVFKNLAQHNTFLFVLTHNFFQLASMIILSDLIISVDSFILDIANANKKQTIQVPNFYSGQVVDDLIKKLSTINY